MSLYVEIYNMYAWGYTCSYMNKVSQMKIFFGDQNIQIFGKVTTIFILASIYFTVLQ